MRTLSTALASRILEKGTINRLFSVLEDVDPSEREELIDDWTVRFGPYNPVFEKTGENDQLQTLLLVKNTTRSYWKNLYLFGDSFGWDIPSYQFTNVKHTDWWYIEFKRPDAARLHYLLSPNDPGTLITPDTRVKRRANWILDPRNPECIREGLKDHSLLTYPNFKEREYVATTNIHYSNLYLRNQLDGSREAKIALITHKDDNPEKLIIAHDGKAFTKIMKGDRILAKGVEEGIWPSVGLLTLNSPIIKRKKEYGGKYGYPEYFKKVIIPSVEHHLGKSFDPEDIILLGSSLGAWAMLDIIAQEPDIADNLILQSCPFWWPDNDHQKYIRWFDSKEFPVSNLYMDVGIYETGRQPLSTYESNVKFANIIHKQDINLMARELMMGHRHDSWKWALPGALDFIFNNKKEFGSKTGRELRYSV